MPEGKGRNEIKIGILAIAAILALFLGFNFLKGNSLFNTDNEYFTYYDDVTGLTPAAQVMINGYQVGKVADIEMMANQHFKVTLNIKDDFRVTKGSTAQLLSNDLLSGAKVITLVPGQSKELAPEGTTLKGQTSAGILDNLGDNVSPMITTASNAVTNIDSVVLSLKQIVDDDARMHLRNSMASLDVTMRQMELLTSALNQQTKNLNAVMTNANSTMRHTNSVAENLAASNARITAILTNAEGATNQLNQAKIRQTVDNLEATTNKLNSLISKIDNDKGTLGLMVNDPKLYNNLTKTVEDLGNLADDLKKHPGKYINISVFGSRKTAE